MTQNRRPAGTPTGGQFAGRNRNAASITLDDTAMSQVRDMGRGRPLSERRALYANAAADFAQRAAERHVQPGPSAAAPSRRRREDLRRAFTSGAKFPLSTRLARAGH